MHLPARHVSLLPQPDTLFPIGPQTDSFASTRKQGNGGYGQNLAAWGGSGSIDDLKVKTAASGVTEQWYNGEFNSFQYYGQANPSSNFEDWGHFTQVVWKSSTKVGCATVKCGAGSVLSSQSWFTVCNYNPAGKLTCLSSRSNWRAGD